MQKLRNLFGKIVELVFGPQSVNPLSLRMLVSSGCFNIVYTLRGLNNTHLLLILEAGNFKFKVTDWVPLSLVFILLWYSTWPFLGEGSWRRYQIFTTK